LKTRDKGKKAGRPSETSFKAKHRVFRSSRKQSLVPPLVHMQLMQAGMEPNRPTLIVHRNTWPKGHKKELLKNQKEDQAKKTTTGEASSTTRLSSGPDNEGRRRTGGAFARSM